MPFESGRQFLDSGLDDLDFHIDSFLSIDPEFTGLEVPPITEGIFEPSRPPDIILTKTPGDNQPVQQGGSWYSIIQSAIQTVPGLINAIKGQPGTTIQV